MKQSLLVSLIAHILLLVAIILWPQSSLPKRTTTITIQAIQIKPPPKPVVRNPAPPIQPPPPPPRIKPRNEQQIARRIEKLLKNRRRTPKRKPTPAPTRVRRKRTPTPVQKKPTPTLTPKSRMKFTPFEQVAQTQATQPPVTQTPEAEFSTDKQVVFEKGFNYQGYADRLMRTLSRSWDPPAWKPERQEGIYTQICFTIQSNGTIVNAYVERPSGWPELDESALRAVRKASPAESLPAGYGRRSVRAHARFRPIR